MRSHSREFRTIFSGLFFCTRHHEPKMLVVESMAVLRYGGMFIHEELCCVSPRSRPRRPYPNASFALLKISRVSQERRQRFDSATSNASSVTGACVGAAGMGRLWINGVGINNGVGVGVGGSAGIRSGSCSPTHSPSRRLAPPGSFFYGTVGFPRMRVDRFRTYARTCTVFSVVGPLDEVANLMLLDRVP